MGKYSVRRNVLGQPAWPPLPLQNSTGLLWTVCHICQPGVDYLAYTGIPSCHMGQDVLFN